MATTGNAPVAQPQQQSWISNLLNQHYGAQQERVKRQPVGFNFTREPFDPSSYYKALGSFRDISRNATGVVMQEVANKEQADAQRAYEENQAALNNAIGGINPKFTYDDTGGGNFTGKSRKYGLKSVSGNTASAADYFGSKFGIKNIGGYRDHGSVPNSDHPKGLALDFMTYKNKKQGNALAQDVLKNYKQWNVKYVIWNRYIWSPGKGWRAYHGPSPHTDHVHVSFNR